MKRHNDLTDTKQLPQLPPEEPQQTAPVRRASMHGGTQQPRTELPVRRASADDVQSKKKKRKKKQSGSPAKRILLTVFTVILLLFVLYSAFSFFAIKQLRKADPETHTVTAAAPFSDPAVRNILLIGSDSRGDERGRADSIILLSVSRANHTVTLTSLLRDSYVSIPGHGTDKLNAAYSYGGAALLADTVVNNFNIRVDDYFSVGFVGFVHLADALGGTEITLSDREAQAVNEILHNEVNEIMGDPADADYLAGGGTLHLNGKQTLAYSRIRYVGNADFERTERQRTVLSQLLSNAKHLRVSGVQKIMTDVLPEITTNLSEASLYGLSLTMPAKLLIYDMQTLRLPADGTYENQYAADGAMVLAVNFDANLALYRDAVLEPHEKDDTADSGEGAAE